MLRLLALPLLFLATLVVAQEGDKKVDDKKDDDKKVEKKNDDKTDEKFVSGPQAGALLPGPYPVFNINGPRKGRFHCVVLDFAHDPAVVAFVREPEEGKDEAILTFIQKLDDALERHNEVFLKCAVVFLSPDARSSATEKKIEDPKLLVQEATARQALMNRMAARATKNAAPKKEPDKTDPDEKPDKKEKKDDKKPDDKKPDDKKSDDDTYNVILAVTVPDGPKDYNLSPKAGVTVLFYRKLKMIENWSFEADSMTAEDADRIIAKVDKYFADAKKPANPKKK